MNRATPSTGWARNPDGTLGWTWNPITGCLNHTDGRCNGGGFRCYAYGLAHGRLRQRYLANARVSHVLLNSTLIKGVPVYSEDELDKTLADPFYPRFWPERLRELIPYPFCNPDDKVPAPKGVFVCDMSDLFGIGIPQSWTEDVIEMIERCPQHRFYLLTKQPQNLARWSPFPDNCWVGVTVTGQEQYNAAQFHLQEVDAAIKFLSIEPFLSPIEFKPGDWEYEVDDIQGCITTLDLIIIGSQTKPTVMPKIEWVREIIEAADMAGVSVFLKDNLRPLLVDALTEHQIDREPFFVKSERSPYGWKLRQEMPNK